MGRGGVKGKTGVIVHMDTGCWVWQGAPISSGYGLKYLAPGRTTLAHRWYYEQRHGLIPRGLQIDHLCRNRRCVNPEHLEMVTNAENSRRGAKAKLTWTNIRAIRASDASHTELGRRFGVTPTQIRTIRKNEQWYDPSYEAGERDGWRALHREAA